MTFVSWDFIVFLQKYITPVPSSRHNTKSKMSLLLNETELLLTERPQSKVIIAVSHGLFSVLFKIKETYSLILKAFVVLYMLYV